MSWLWSLVLCVVGSSLLWAAAARADEPGEPAGTPAVLYVGEAGDDAGPRVEAALAALRPTVVLASEPVALESLLPEPAGSSGLAVLGADGSGCGGATLDGAAWRRGLETLAATVDQLEPAAARAAELRVGLACLTEPVRPEEIARVDFLAATGASELDPSARDVARAGYARALTVVEDVPGWEDLAPARKDLYLDAQKQVRDGPQALLRVVASPGSFVWVDGRLVEAPLAGLELPAGEHLVQVRGPAEARARGALVELGATPALIVEGAALSGSDEGLPGRVRAVLEAAEVAPAHLVVLGARDDVYSWQPPLLLPMSGEPVIDPALLRARRLEGSGVTLTLAGAGMAAAGVTLVATGWSDYLQGIEDGTSVDGAQARFGAGWALTGVGSAAVFAGSHLLAEGARSRRYGSVTVTPGVAWVGIDGTF